MQSSKRRQRQTRSQGASINATTRKSSNDDIIVKKRRPVVSKTRKRASPPRPKRPSTFELPAHLFELSQKSFEAQVPRSRFKSKDGPTASVEPPHVRLSRIIILMNAIHRRNKNQHRSQLFYKHFSLLRQALGRLVTLHEQSARISGDRSDKGRPSTTAASIRQNFEKESQLRSQREVLEEHIRETIIPVAYVTFTALVADAQFANLGMVLLGLLSDVTGAVGTMTNRAEARVKTDVMVEKELSPLASGKTLVGLSTLVTGPDQGTVVERTYDSDQSVATRDGKVAGRVYGDRDIDMGEVVQRSNIDENVRFENTVSKGQNVGHASPPISARASMTHLSTIAAPATTATTAPDLSISISATDPPLTKPSKELALAASTTIPRTSKEKNQDRKMAKPKKTEKAEKTKKKGKNAIDDLFAGFG